MQNNTISVQSLSAADSSRVQIGNTYNTTNQYHKSTDQDDITKSLLALRSTDPRQDKYRIESGCLLRDSYIWILNNEEFLTWRDKGHGGRLLWVKGDPGKGKTMLLCGIINELQPSTMLENPENRISLSYFFCQATNSGLNNYTAVLRGLIYLLVIQQPCLLSHLHDKQVHDTTHWNARVAMEDIFHKVIADPALQEIYLIVDALDECLHDLGFLLKLISTTCSRVKWIVSSRNRSEIEEHLGQMPTKLPLSLELHEECVSQAVMSYIGYRTNTLADKKKLKHNVVQQVYHYLSRHAHGTFLWVALVCQQLERSRAWEISQLLLQFPEGLTKLFARMMDQVLTSYSRELYIRLLAIASTVFRPITFSELMAMEELTFDEEMLPDVIAECGSFLTTKENTIFFIHQSAKDFLLTESSALLFQPSLSQHHYNLFQRSITMIQALHMDIYGLVYPGVSLEEAIRNRPVSDPLHGLEYACVFWADHLKEAYTPFVQDGNDGGNPYIKAAHQFIADKFLFWLEALSISKNLSAAANALLFLETLPASLSQPDNTALVKDGLRFFHFFRPVIENYPLQIYASGLLFSPQESLIRHRFKVYTPEIFATTPRCDATWSPIWSIFETSSIIRTMKFSPTSQILVTALFNSELLNWGVSDGSVHKRTKHDNARWPTPSPDLKWLAVITMRNSDGAEQTIQDTLQVRGLNTNSIHWTQELGNSKVRGMELSPDNRWLAVCYQEKLELYALEGGMHRVWPLQLDPDEQNYSITFSSDCALVALLGVQEGSTVRVLDLRMGKQYESPNPEDDSRINDAKFIPDTYLLMFCTTEGGIHLWDVFEQKCKEWAFFDGHLSCLAFSNNESWIAIATFDRLLLYDRHQRTLLQQLELPSKDCPSIIAVSPDDQKIAIGENKRMWLLDVRALLAVKPVSQQRDHGSSHVSNDGRLIASVLDAKIELRDATTGKILSVLSIQDVIKGHVRAMAFSPKGQQIAFSDMSSIFVWNLATDNLRHISKVDGPSSLLALSNETSSGSHWVAVNDSFRSVTVWGITTGKRVRSIEPSDRLLQDLSAVAFAGSRLGVLWCSGHAEDGTQDALFVLYNIETGEQLSRIGIPWHWSLFQKHSGLFLPPSGKFVISYVSVHQHLLLSFLEAGTYGVRIRTNARNIFFLDDLTVSTEQGIFRIDSILADAIHELGTRNHDSIGTGNRMEQTLPTVSPTFEAYGRSTECDWITLDNKPLLWLPLQYRQDVNSLMAIGRHHVMIESPSGIYSISFRSDAEDHLRRAICDLVL